MAFAAHTRVSFGGALGQVGEPQDIWQCTLNVISKTTGAWLLLDERNALGAAAQTAMNTLWDASPDVADAWMSAAARLDYVKLADITPAGLYTADSPSLWIMNGHYPQGVAASGMPEILCVGYSWLTGKVRGPGHRGRMYLPTAANRVSLTSMKITDNARAAHLLLAVRLIASLCGVITAGEPQYAIPVVASNVNATNTAITGVAVGDIIDVQRRRKNAYAETYATSAL